SPIRIFLRGSNIAFRLSYSMRTWIRFSVIRLQRHSFTASGAASSHKPAARGATPPEPRPDRRHGGHRPAALPRPGQSPAPPTSPHGAGVRPPAPHRSRPPRQTAPARTGVPPERRDNPAVRSVPADSAAAAPARPEPAPAHAAGGP